jgi:hypothetical protein|tara:strand:- start:2886 stop:3143 length:258 start_codon:yes stop_codon:yes gene_type:complete
MKNILTVAVMAFSFLFIGAGCNDKTEDCSEDTVEQADIDHGAESPDVVEASDTLEQTDTNASSENTESVDVLPGDSIETAEVDSE